MRAFAAKDPVPANQDQVLKHCFNIINTLIKTPAGEIRQKFYELDPNNELKLARLLPPIGQVYTNLTADLVTPMIPALEQTLAVLAEKYKSEREPLKQRLASETAKRQQELTTRLQEINTTRDSKIAAFNEAEHTQIAAIQQKQQQIAKENASRERIRQRQEILLQAKGKVEEVSTDTASVLTIMGQLSSAQRHLPPEISKRLTAGAVEITDTPGFLLKLSYKKGETWRDKLKQAIELDKKTVDSHAHTIRDKLFQEEKSVTFRRELEEIKAKLTSAESSAPHLNPQNTEACTASESTSDCASGFETKLNMR